MKRTLLAIGLFIGASAFSFSQARAEGEGALAYNAAATAASFGTGGQDDASLVIFYPNPVKEELSVRFPVKGNYTVYIYNIIGDKIKEKSVIDDTEVKLNLGDLQNGMFFLSYEFEGRIVTKRFTKSN